MATTFPTSLDSFTNPTAADSLDSATVPHAAQHATINDAVAALEVKVGIDGSAVQTTLDYKLSGVTGAAKAVSTASIGTAASHAATDFDTAGAAAAAQAASQPLDGTLTAFAALTIAANSLTIGSGADAFSQVTFAANTFPARSSSGNLVAKTLSDFALTFLDDADAATVRTTIGAGTSSFSGAYGSLTGTPSTFAPSAHASSHLPGGSDALTTAAPAASNPGDAQSAGSAASFARSDHVHAREDVMGPSSQPTGDQTAPSYSQIYLADDPYVLTNGDVTILAANSLLWLDSTAVITAPLQFTPQTLEPTLDTTLIAGTTTEFDSDPLILDSGRLLTVQVNALLWGNAASCPTTIHTLLVIGV